MLKMRYLAPFSNLKKNSNKKFPIQGNHNVDSDWQQRMNDSSDRIVSFNDASTLETSFCVMEDLDHKFRAFSPIPQPEGLKTTSQKNLDIGHDDLDHNHDHISNEDQESDTSFNSDLSSSSSEREVRVECICLKVATDTFFQYFQTILILKAFS